MGNNKSKSSSSATATTTKATTTATTTTTTTATTTATTTTTTTATTTTAETVTTTSSAGKHNESTSSNERKVDHVTDVKLNSKEDFSGLVENYQKEKQQQQHETEKKEIIFPENEKERVEVLNLRGLLNSDPREDAFDNITQMAAALCKCPVSVMNIIGDDVFWYKSSTFPHTVNGSGPRDISVCTHTISQPDGVLVIPDLSQDPRFCQNPLYTKLGMKFYAGATIITKEGHNVGTICVVDRKTRELPLEIIESLRALSRQAAAEIEMKYPVTGRDDRLLRSEMAKRVSAVLFPMASTVTTEPHQQNQQFDVLSSMNSLKRKDVMRNKLQDFLNTNEGMEIFLHFLEKEFSSENLIFWQAVERFRDSPTRETADYIFKTFLTKESIMEVNIPFSTIKEVEEKISHQEITETLFDNCQSQVFRLMEIDSFKRFLESEEYKEYMERKELRIQSKRYSADHLQKVSQIEWPSFFYSQQFV